jgi:hypothetical protein
MLFNDVVSTTEIVYAVNSAGSSNNLGINLSSNKWLINENETGNASLSIQY